MTETQSLILFKQRQWCLKANKEIVTKVSNLLLQISLNEKFGKNDNNLCYRQHSNSRVANEFIGVLFEFCNSS